MIKHSGEIENRTAVQYAPAAVPMTEATWQAWLTRNRADETRGARRQMTVIKLISIGALLTMAALWAFLGPYERALMFAAALGATALMFREFHDRRYALVVAFGVIAFLYNPVFPIFPASGGWQRLILLASITPFLASLLWSQRRNLVSARVGEVSDARRHGIAQ